MQRLGRTRRRPNLVLDPVRTLGIVCVHKLLKGIEEQNKKHDDACVTATSGYRREYQAGCDSHRTREFRIDGGRLLAKRRNNGRPMPFNAIII